MAVKQSFQLTQEGADELKVELKLLKDEKRGENLEALVAARAQGDLSENADYDAARNEQARIESRISEIENIFKYLKIIKKTNQNIVDIGKTVKLRLVEKKEDREFLFVGSIEANPSVGKISIESPLGKAVLNHSEGDVVLVKRPTGKGYSVKILGIS